jgi:starvation-inducible DNA-binding protein
VDPYPKPIILNHDLNSEPIGRVIAAKMDKEEDGSHFVRLQLAITDPVAAQKISDQRYLTGSVGGRAGKAVCSISGEDLATEDAGGRPKAPRYKRGTVHKGKMAYIDMQEISFKEYSFVNQPADQRSSVRSKKTVDGKAAIADSENWVAKSKAFVLHMNEEDIVSIEENESILNTLKKKESRPLYLHMKGAFLSAVAIQESENSNKTNDSLLSIKNEDNDSHEENSNMDENVNSEDILAAVEDLSQDLSNIAAGTVQESDPEGSEDSTESPEAPEAPEAPEVSEESEKNTEEADVSGSASSMQKVLNEMIVLAFVAQRAHWNVTGTDFEEYHALFGAIYEDIFDSVDAVAEEIRKMGAMVENLTNMIMSSSFKDDTSASDARTLTQDVLAKNIMLNNTVLEAFASCSESNEQGAADVLAARDGMHKKWSWQLRSSLGEEAGEPADESWREIGSKEITESVEELVEKVIVDSTDTVTTEVKEESAVSETDLTGANKAPEQDVEEARLHALQEENRKLKEALHRTLAERVVDTKISIGTESIEDREELIKDHTTRSAGSLADSLRDLAKLPSVKKSIHGLSESILENDVVSEKEENVLEEDEDEVIEQPKAKANTVEELFVDALMGRRKL